MALKGYYCSLGAVARVREKLYQKLHPAPEINQYDRDSAMFF
jgi:hypothetical protein